MKSLVPISDEGEVLPKTCKQGRLWLLAHETPLLSPAGRAEVLLGWLRGRIVPRMLLDEGLTEHQIDQIRKELVRWQDAGFPSLQEWPMTSLCLSELGLADKES